MFISALLQTLYTSKAYIVITDPGIHLATTKTVYLFIGQVCVYVTDVPIVEIVKEGPTLSWLLNRCSF